MNIFNIKRVTSLDRNDDARREWGLITGAGDLREVCKRLECVPPNQGLPVVIVAIAIGYLSRSLSRLG